MQEVTADRLPFEILIIAAAIMWSIYIGIRIYDRRKARKKAPPSEQD